MLCGVIDKAVNSANYCEDSKIRSRCWQSILWNKLESAATLGKVRARASFELITTDFDTLRSLLGDGYDRPFAYCRSTPGIEPINESSFAINGFNSMSVTLTPSCA